jgi:GT2 family glycosyltransferase
VYELADDPELLVVSLRLGWNTTHCYMLDTAQTAPETWKYPWADHDLDFGYPFDLSSSIYRVADVLPLLEMPAYSNPNTLEAFLDWSKDQFKDTRPLLLFDGNSRAFANPLNKVQTIFTGNKSGRDSRYSIERLAALFDKGYRIDIGKFDDYVPKGVHEEVDLSYLLPNGTAYSEEKQPEISLLIPNYNGDGHIQKCLDSVRRTIGNHSYEIIVLDNGSTDASLGYLREQTDIRLIELSENVGVPAARSRLFGEAKGKDVVVMDNDVILTKGWADKCLYWTSVIPNVGIIGPRSNYVSGPQQIDIPVTYNGDIADLEAFAEKWSNDPAHKGQLWSISRMPSFFWFVTRQCLDTIGDIRSFGPFGFDDEDYTIRCFLSGLQVLIDNGMYIHHTGGPQGRGNTTYNRQMIEAWDKFKEAWNLDKDLVYGQTDHLTKIVQTVPFDKERHFIPLKREVRTHD